ncbi:MAG: NDP-sugar synthase [Gaiellaceae bacterium]
MKALLLAAGLGTRLRPAVGALPKAMVPVGGTPLLERTVRWLGANDVRDLAINLHYLPAAITSHFGDGREFGVEIRYSYEPELLGTAGALYPLRDWLREGDQPFLVVYGDNLITLDVSRLLDAHARGGAMATVAVFEREDVSASGVAELNEEGWVVRFVEKPRSGQTSSKWVSAGFLACNPALLDEIQPGFLDFGRDVLPSLVASGHGVCSYRMGAGETLGWIDTPNDLRRLDEGLKQ